MSNNKRSIVNKMYLESYRTIRTNIKYTFLDKKSKVILITSSVSNEGKSVTAINLASVLAKDNKKVLVIDCDLRKPSIHRMMNLSNTIGLSDVLIDEYKVKSAIKNVGGNLYVLTSGTIPPDPLNLLSSDNMDNLLSELKENYEYILLDSAPLNNVSDAQVLSTKADGTILVVRAFSTTRDFILKSKKLLDEFKGKIIGTILNRGVEDLEYYY